MQRPSLKWIYFPIPVPYNISKMAIFGAPSFTPRGDKDIHMGKIRPTFKKNGHWVGGCILGLRSTSISVVDINLDSTLTSIANVGVEKSFNRWPNQWSTIVADVVANCRRQQLGPSRYPTSRLSTWTSTISSLLGIDSRYRLDGRLTFSRL